MTIRDDHFGNPTVEELRERALEERELPKVERIIHPNGSALMAEVGMSMSLGPDDEGDEVQQLSGVHETYEYLPKLLLSKDSRIWDSHCSILTTGHNPWYPLASVRVTESIPNDGSYRSPALFSDTEPSPYDWMPGRTISGLFLFYHNRWQELYREIIG